MNDLSGYYPAIFITIGVYLIVKEIAWWKWQIGFMQWLDEYYHRYPKKEDEWREHLKDDTKEN